MEQDTLTSAPTVRLENVKRAARTLDGVIYKTLLQHNLGLSEAYGAQVYLKREDLQVVRSYKIRGAYNKIAGLSREQSGRDVVCASAGNHAQGVAYACQLLGLRGHIFMPAQT